MIICFIHYDKVRGTKYHGRAATLLKSYFSRSDFRACMYAIKVTDDVFPEKGGPSCSSS